MLVLLQVCLFNPTRTTTTLAGTVPSPHQLLYPHFHTFFGDIEPLPVRSLILILVYEHLVL